jgi:hypothetical protein
MRMQTARLWMLVFVGLIGCSVLTSAQDPKPKPGPADRDPDTDRFISQFLASPRLAAIRGAERIDAFVIETGVEKFPTHFKLQEPAAALDPESVRQVREMATATRSYLGGPGACIFDPGLALRFYKGRDSVQMLVCFTCREVLFQSPSGRVIGDRLHFDRNTMPLLAIARQAFPNLRVFDHLDEIP